MQKWPDWSWNQNISFSLHTSGTKYYITEIHLAYLFFPLIFESLIMYCMTSIVIMVIMVPNQILWYRRVEYFIFMTSLIILTQSKQNLQGFIDSKLLEKASFEQDSLKFQNYVEAKPLKPMIWNFEWINGTSYAFRQNQSEWFNTLSRKFGTNILVQKWHF